MVEDPGKTVCAGAYRPVNLPEPLRVAEDAAGRPDALLGRRRQKVSVIEDVWRLDDEWWRREPLSRLYYRLRLASGERLVLYKDLGDGRWYRQSY